MAKTIHDDRRSSGDDSSDSQTEVNNVDVSISRRRVVQAGIGAIGLGALATSGTEPVLAAEDISFNLPSGDVEAGCDNDCVPVYALMEAVATIRPN